MAAKQIKDIKGIVIKPNQSIWGFEQDTAEVTEQLVTEI